MNIKESIKKIIKDTCSSRINVDKFIDYLEKETDYFIAPASSKYHLNYEEGLAIHSLNVYRTLESLCSLYYEDCPSSTIAICGLFHDLCKTNFYKKEWKYVKKDSQWVQEMGYTIDDQLPLGHGEKSVMLLLKAGFKLTEEEMLAIRWHMSAFDSAVKGGDVSLNTAYNKTPLTTLLQTADLISSHLLEK